MDMTLSFYYYYLFLNELFKKNERKKFDKKKKPAKQTNKQIQNKTKIKWLVPSYNVLGFAMKEALVFTKSHYGSCFYLIALD